MGSFAFMLGESEKKYLKDLVALSIRSKLDGEDSDIPAPPTDKLRRDVGVFVTLKLDGHLRGCIGNIQGTGELYETIWNMARAAAFSDPRFPELTSEEFEKLEVEISVLGPIRECQDFNAVEVGLHGLIAQRGDKTGLLLPQVPVEWGWDRKTFLKQVCLKAGLPEDAWNLAGTRLFWFEAVVF